jgi:hypothetical protein
MHQSRKLILEFLSKIKKMLMNLQEAKMTVLVNLMLFNNLKTPQRTKHNHILLKILNPNWTIKKIKMTDSVISMLFKKDKTTMIKTMASETLVISKSQLLEES